MSGRTLRRRAAALLASGLFVAACASTAATPSGASPSDSPATSPSSAPYFDPSIAPWRADEPSKWPSADESMWPEESPTPVPTAWPKLERAVFPITKGTAALASPAADHGSAAGSNINDFGFDLLRHLNADGNLCFSPTSIAIASAMVRPGANGATATEMDAVMHGFGAPGQSSEMVALMKQLSLQTIYADGDGFPAEPGATPVPGGNQNPLIELRITNQAFAQPGMTIKQPYLDSLSSSFGAGVGQLDFIKDPEAARLVINKWANYATRGRIPDVLQPGDIDNATRIALANAIYMNAPWASPFPADLTKSRAFTTDKSVKINVPTMQGGAGVDYAAGPGYRAASMPLSYASTLSMTVIVPDDMAAFTNSLTAPQLAAISTKLAASQYIVTLWMPRFSLNTKFELADTLKSMGMTSLFDPNAADLTGITTDPIASPLYIQKVVHQANIDVNEDGVIAAAVTIEIGGKGSVGGDETPPPKVDFHVDKPFLYLIRETQSGAILFLGRVNDPSVKS
jgi:serpin B